MITSANRSTSVGIFKHLENLRANYIYYVLKILQYFGQVAVLQDDTHVILNFLRDNKHVRFCQVLSVDIAFLRLGLEVPP